MIDWESLTAADWIARIIWLLSALAAWGALWLSWHNHRRLRRQESVVLEAKADHHEVLKPNGTRKLSEERLNIRIFNKGRSLQIESVMLLPEGIDQIPRGLFDDHKSGRQSALLETHRTYIMSVKVEDLLKLDDVRMRSKPIRVWLADGERLDLMVKGLVPIVNRLRAFKRDLENGLEVLLPSVYVWVGNQGKSIEAWEGPIPPEAELKHEAGSPERDEPVADEDAWRTGRTPQREAIEAARAKKRHR
ncbi:MAG: hypothetical protein KJZ54_16165 [Phycisphaerales bacterium]|nr:hypothetical protein [Phycisphaerales bacterium]